MFKIPSLPEILRECSSSFVCHVSHVMGHMSHFSFLFLLFLSSDGASRCRVCYQRGFTTSSFLTCPVQVLESIVQTLVNDEIHLLALATTSTLMDCVEGSARDSFEMHCNSPDVQLHRVTGWLNTTECPERPDTKLFCTVSCCNPPYKLDTIRNRAINLS